MLDLTEVWHEQRRCLAEKGRQDYEDRLAKQKLIITYQKVISEAAREKSRNYVK